LRNEFLVKHARPADLRREALCVLERHRKVRDRRELAIVETHEHCAAGVIDGHGDDRPVLNV
jgi:hypothetical protein